MERLPRRSEHRGIRRDATRVSCWTKVAKLLFDSFRSGASEILNKYFEEIGGRPQHTGKLGKRKSASSMKGSSDLPAPKKSKRINGKDDESVDDTDRKTGTWMPKKENWEKEIASIDTVERDRETGKLWAFIHFNNKKRSKIGMELVYKHCPFAMLKFYESHLSVSTHIPEISSDLLCPSPTFLSGGEISGAAEVSTKIHHL
jgi:Chromo shadow domain